MNKTTRFALVAALVAGLFGSAAAVNQASAGPGCPTGVIVLPSLNPSYPGVNVNVCVNGLGVNAEVAGVAGVDLNALYVGTQAQVICIYTPLGMCAVPAGPTGVDVNLPGPNPVQGPLGPSGDPCVGSNCVFLYVSGTTGSIRVIQNGATVLNVPLSDVCVRYRSTRPCTG